MVKGCWLTQIGWGTAQTASACALLAGARRQTRPGAPGGCGGVLGLGSAASRGFRDFRAGMVQMRLRGLQRRSHALRQQDPGCAERRRGGTAPRQRRRRRYRWWVPCMPPKARLRAASGPLLALGRLAGWAACKPGALRPRRRRCRSAAGYP